MRQPDGSVTVAPIAPCCKIHRPSALPKLRKAAMVDPLRGEVRHEGVVVGREQGAAADLAGERVRHAIGNRDTATSKSPPPPVSIFGLAIHASYGRRDRATVLVVPYASCRDLSYPSNVEVPRPSSSISTKEWRVAWRSTMAACVSRSHRRNYQHECAIRFCCVYPLWQDQPRASRS